MKSAGPAERPERNRESVGTYSEYVLYPSSQMALGRVRETAATATWTRTTGITTTASASRSGHTVGNSRRMLSNRAASIFTTTHAPAGSQGPLQPPQEAVRPEQDSTLLAQQPCALLHRRRTAGSGGHSPPDLAVQCGVQRRGQQRCSGQGERQNEHSQSTVGASHGTPEPAQRSGKARRTQPPDVRRKAHGRSRPSGCFRGSMATLRRAARSPCRPAARPRSATSRAVRRVRQHHLPADACQRPVQGVRTLNLYWSPASVRPPSVGALSGAESVADPTDFECHASPMTSPCKVQCNTKPASWAGAGPRSGG